MNIEDKVSFLRQATHYPDQPENIEVVETHMSLVFLTDQWVYKLKKPVCFDFIDFSTLEARHHNCENEVRLNRRLAGNVYQGVVPLNLKADGQLELGGKGNPVEWLVKMIRLPRERMLDQMIEKNMVQESDVQRFSSILANFYSQATPVPMSSKAYRQRFENAIHANHTQLSKTNYGLEFKQVEAVSQRLQNFLIRKPGLFDTRVKYHRIIEAHGDLRPEHICLIDPPVFIDCLEFNRSFRLLDPADELAFLAMACERAGAAFIGEIAFETYRTISNDQPEQLLVCFYKVFRAQLRATLSIVHLDDHPRDSHSKWIKQSNSYLDLATDYLDELA